MLRDRIQKQVYPNRRNTATILNYLEELILINAKEVGLVPIEQCKKGYRDVPLPFGKVVSLDVPEEAVSAKMILEIEERAISNSFFTQNKTCFKSKDIVVARYKENAFSPGLRSGFGLSNLEILNIIGRENLENFRIIGIKKTLRVVIRLQFYKTAQEQG